MTVETSAFDYDVVRLVMDLVLLVGATGLALATWRWGRRAAVIGGVAGLVLGLAALAVVTWPAALGWAHPEPLLREVLPFAAAWIAPALLGVLIGACLRAAEMGRRRWATGLLVLLAPLAAASAAETLVLLAWRWRWGAEIGDLHPEAVSDRTVAWMTGFALATACAWWWAWTQVQAGRRADGGRRRTPRVLAGLFAGLFVLLLGWRFATFTVF